jgi:hypothetical protein
VERGSAPGAAATATVEGIEGAVGRHRELKAIADPGAVMTPPSARARAGGRSCGTPPGRALLVVKVSYPSKRYRSTLISIAVHSAQSILVLGLVLALVLKG